MRASADFVRTASLSASYEETTWPSRTTSVVRSLRLPMRCSARRARCSSGKSSSTVMAVRNPRPPRFTGKSGISRRPMARAAESSVPSPPSTTMRSQPSGTDSRGRPGTPAYSAEFSSMRALMPRALSHSSTLGTSSRAPSEPGLETIPTVLMMGIKEELLVSFRAENRAVHDLRFESEFSHGPGHPPAGRLVQLGLADNPAFSHLALAYFKLRLDQYNHSAAGLEKRDGGGQNERHRDEADVAGEQVHPLADLVEREFASVDALVDNYARIGADGP